MLFILSSLFYFLLMFDFKTAKARSALYRSIRSFFDGRGYLEVFTPTLSTTLIPEPTIQNFSTEFTNEFVGNRELYLIPSPEIYMKALLASGSPSIYQISECFRNSEQIGRLHSIEFTMLEYYTLGYDEMDSIALTVDLIKETTPKDAPPCVKRPIAVMSVNEACMEHASLDIEKCQECGALKEKAESLGLYVPDGEEWDDTFNRIFLTFVEPNLPKDRPVALIDYPWQIECLAKRKEGTPYRQRWEMYINGVEIANCYAEEESPEKTEAYYRKEYEKLRKDREGRGLVIPKMSEGFPKMRIPKSSGVAIGLDRLLMAYLGKDSIAPLLLFSLSDNMHLGL